MEMVKHYAFSGCFPPVTFHSHLFILTAGQPAPHCQCCKQSLKQGLVVVRLLCSQAAFHQNCEDPE